MPPRDASPKPDAPIGWCHDCRKLRYRTRQAARRAARRHHTGEHMSAYRCRDAWHIGHLPPSVTAGEKTRDDLRKDTP